MHSGSRERDRRCGDSGGGRRHLGRGRQPPLVLKPETTRSGLIYRERRGRGGGWEEDERWETRSTEGGVGEGWGAAAQRGTPSMSKKKSNPTEQLIVNPWWDELRGQHDF